MIVKLLTEHHLEFLSLKVGCRGSYESTHVKCHIVGNLMHGLIFLFILSVILKCLDNCDILRSFIFYFFFFLSFSIKLALTCDFQQYGILTSLDSNKPVQPHF